MDASKIKKIFFFVAIAILFFLLIFVFIETVNGGTTTGKKAGIVKCGLNFTDQEILSESGYDTKTPCTMCDLVLLASNSVNYFILVIVPAIATLLFLFAGFLIILGGATPSQIQTGKTMFRNTVYGLLIIYSAWMIANTIFKSLAGDSDISNNWYKVECTGTGVPGPSAGDLTPVTTTVGNCSGVQCSDSSVNICQPNSSASCSTTTVNKWNSQIAAVAGRINICSGLDTGKMLKAIMSQESGGVLDRTSGDGTSFGLMQLKPATANQYKSGCTSDEVTAGWLLNNNNAQASICIAANYLKSFAGECGCNAKQLAAGYNGGSGACAVSTNCGPSAQADGGTCSICSNQSSSTKRWECLWDDNKHQICNANRTTSSFDETRVYAPKVEYCYTKF